MIEKSKNKKLQFIIVSVIYILMISMFAYGKLNFNILLINMIFLVVLTYYLIVEYRLLGMLFTSFFYIAGFVSIGILFKFSEYHYNAVMAFQVVIVISSFSLYKYVKKVEISQKELFNQSVIDEVTGIYNRRYSNMKLEEVFEYSKNNSQKFSLFILDIDKFKAINDSHGHAYGDKILKEFSNEMQRNLRSSDTFCRIGGDEFAIIALNHIDENIHVITERIKQVTIDINRRFVYELNGEFSVSVGFSVYPNDAEGIEEMIRCADDAMYEAKNYNDSMLISFCDMKKSIVD